MISDDWHNLNTKAIFIILPVQGATTASPSCGVYSTLTLKGLTS